MIGNAHEYNYMFGYTGRLLDGLDDIKNVLAKKATNSTENPDEMNTQIESVAKASTRKLCYLSISHYQVVNYAHGSDDLYE